MIDDVPQPGNLLTNYVLDLSNVNDESLWLCSYYYEAAQAYKGEKGPKGLPVTRRHDGWNFLIADAADIQKLNRVTMDGETVLVRVSDEFVDIVTLSWASDVANTFIPQIAQCRHLPQAVGANIIEELGIPQAVLQNSAILDEWYSNDNSRF